MNKQTTQDFIDGEYMDYCKYVISSRSLPCYIDGFKPVQRKLMYSALISPTKQQKLVELGSIAKFGYHHAETAAADAAIGMAQDWSNHAPLLQGFGNFGTRFVHKSAAPRYIFANVSKNYDQYFGGYNDVLTYDESDADSPEPKTYEPSIPWVLVSGARGIAVGFATIILPRDPKDVKRACRDYIRTGKAPEVLMPSFPGLKTNVTRPDPKGKPHKYISVGAVELIGGRTYKITELPWGYDRESFMEVLCALEDDGTIGGFEDECGQSGFQFSIKVTPTQRTKIEKLGAEKVFKLIKPFTENLNTVDEDRNLVEFDHVGEIISRFCDRRIGVIQKNIDFRINSISGQIAAAKSKRKFIEVVLRAGSKISKMKKDELIDWIMTEISVDESTAQTFARLPIYSLTAEEIGKQSDLLTQYEADLVGWTNASPDVIFLNELK